MILPIPSADIAVFPAGFTGAAVTGCTTAGWGGNIPAVREEVSQPAEQELLQIGETVLPGFSGRVSRSFYKTGWYQDSGFRIRCKTWCHSLVCFLFILI
jgi:hypothetical protein